MSTCNICRSSLKAPVYRSDGATSITSLCDIYQGKTEVFLCDRCGHLQTTEVTGLDAYYDTTYKILTDSEEEDQLYEIRESKKIYRVEHQMQTLISKVSLPEGARVLDYGCAKSSMLRRLIQTRPDITPHLFDVSEMYVPFWEKFAQPEHWATYEPNKKWTGLFDVVTSFFSLEHVGDPHSMLTKIRSFLKPEGLCYIIVPNVFTNIADYVVVDHVNHFTETSIRYLLSKVGFDPLEIDGEIHRGAFVIVARKADISEERCPDWEHQVTDVQERMREVGAFWQDLSHKVKTFEQAYADRSNVAIYGSGFYGSFILSCLSAPKKVTSFIDQSSFRKGKVLFEKPILGPEKLDPDIDVVYVGLNPKIAQVNIDRVEAWNGRKIHYFFL